MQLIEFYCCVASGSKYLAISNCLHFFVVKYVVGGAEESADSAIGVKIFDKLTGKW